MEPIEQLREDFKDHAEADSRNFKDLRDDMCKGFETINDGIMKMTEVNEKLAKAQEPLTEAYRGTIFVKQFITGLSGTVLALAAIGAAIIWIVNVAVRH